MFRTRSAIALAAAVLLWGSARANTLYVSPTGKYGTHTAYTTIQAAVNNAASGDTILVAAATYQEDVTIGTAGIILKGHKHGVDPRPGRTGPESIVQGSININAGNVHVNGFTVNSAEQQTIGVFASGCVVNYNIVTSSIYGIYVTASSGNVAYNLVTSGNSAIAVFSSTNIRVRYNKVTSTPDGGVDNYYSNYTIIENNECDNCQTAISLRGSHYCTVTNNFGAGDTNGVAVGEGSTNNTIANNTFN